MRLFCLPIGRNLQPFRLRVIANSDSAADQSKKLCVRDAVLSLARRWPAPLAPVRRAARAIDPTARVRRGNLAFGGYASPAIEIRLGRAAGHNWWGVLFPAQGVPAGEAAQFESWFVMILKKWGWI